MKDGRLLSEPLKFQSWRETELDCPLEFAVIIHKHVVFNKTLNSSGSTKYIFYCSVVWLPVPSLMLYDNILLIRALMSADLVWLVGITLLPGRMTLDSKSDLFELPE